MGRSGRSLLDGSFLIEFPPIGSHRKCYESDMGRNVVFDIGKKDQLKLEHGGFAATPDGSVPMFDT